MLLATPDIADSGKDYNPVGVLNEGKATSASCSVQSRKKWLAQVDDFRTFLCDFVSNVPQVGPMVEMSRLCNGEVLEKRCRGNMESFA